MYLLERCIIMFKLFFHRIALAALHFNENTKRQQAVNREGQNQYSMSFPKARKMEAVVREVKVEQTFSKCYLTAEYYQGSLTFLGKK